MPTLTRQRPGPATKAAPIEDGWPDDDGLKCLIFGASGNGKTTFASTFPGPIRWIICSGAVRSGELRSVDTAELRAKIRPKRLGQSSDMKELIEEAKSGEYKTVVLDHVSGLQDLILKETLGLSVIPTQKSWGLASQQQYGQVAMQCKEYLRALLDLHTNVVILGQERTTGGGDTDLSSEIITPTVGVALMPSIAGWLYPACDFLTQIYKRPKYRQGTAVVAGREMATSTREKGVEYVLRCEPHDVIVGKFRIPRGRELRDIIDPSYTKMLAMINGED